MKATLTFTDDCCHSCRKPCADIVVCLSDEWAAKTVSGLPVVDGTIITTNKIIEYINPSPNCTLRSGREKCEYIIDIELDDQFLDDPETNDPYTPEDEDIEGISFDSCVVNKLANFIVEGPDFRDFQGEPDAEGTLTIADFTVTSLRYWKWGQLVTVRYQVQVVLGGTDDEFIILPLPVPGGPTSWNQSIQVDDNGVNLQTARVYYAPTEPNIIRLRQENLALWPDGATYNISDFLSYEAAT